MRGMILVLAVLMFVGLSAAPEVAGTDSWISGFSPVVGGNAFVCNDNPGGCCDTPLARKIGMYC